MTIDLLQRFDPEPDGLLRAISTYVDDEMLTEISLADYGEDAEGHLAALRMIRDTGTFPLPMQWCPSEVLELIRWSEPEDPCWKPGRTGEFGHWMRAFCCVALLRATREPWNYGDGAGTDSTVAQLTVSLHTLPVEFTADAVRFMAWLLNDPRPNGCDGQVCCYAVCLLWFALHLPSASDQGLTSLASWIIQRADELFIGLPGGNRGLREMVATCQAAASWEKIALMLLDLDLCSKSNDLQVRVQEIAEQLVRR